MDPGTHCIHTQTIALYDTMRHSVIYAAGLVAIVLTACSKEKAGKDATPYITEVFEYMPAPGQFVNTMPLYEDTQETMNRKVLEAIGNNNRGLISLGGWGGYVVVGFDHTIENREGLCDFRVLGNAFGDEGGSSEPGIIMVSVDANGNGLPDDPWYEIAGSAHTDPAQEAWYQAARDNGNDVALHPDYSMTYLRPEQEPAASEEEEYILWEDILGRRGSIPKNKYHTQPYFPQWYGEDRLSFSGTCLPQNGIDESGEGTYFVLYKFRYGYADNDTNSGAGSAVDISWAVDSRGQSVDLPGVDFIRIYTGVNQVNGWIGECSTEIMGVEDLHLLGEEIATD